MSSKLTARTKITKLKKTLIELKKAYSLKIKKLRAEKKKAKGSIKLAIDRKITTLEISFKKKRIVIENKIDVLKVKKNIAEETHRVAQDITKIAKELILTISYNSKSDRIKASFYSSSASKNKHFNISMYNKNNESLNKIKSVLINEFNDSSYSQIRIKINADNIDIEQVFRSLNDACNFLDKFKLN